MRLLDFELEDFMSHRHTAIDCTKFQSVVIIGQSRNNLRESMGVGKTTIFKAIEYVFFNYVPFNMEKVVRHGAEKCRVTASFEVASGTYKVVRARTKKGKADLRLYQLVNDVWTDITQKTAKETEAELAKIIKISHGAFRASILFAQADLHGLASVTPRERKAMLKEPLQILIYNEYEKLAKKRSASALKDVEKTRTLIEALGFPEPDIVSLEETLKELQVALQTAQTDRETCRTRLDVARNQLTQLTGTATVDPTQLRVSLNALLQTKQKCQANIDSVTRAIQSDLTKESQNELTIVKTTELIQGLEKKQEDLVTRTVRDVAIVQGEIQKLSSKEIEGAGLLTSLNNDKTKYSKEIPDRDLCDLCKQPVSAEHRQNCEEKRLADLKETIAKIEQTQKVLTAIRAKKVGLETEIRDIDAHTRAKESVVTALTQRRAELDHAKKSAGLIAEAVLAKTSELTNLKNSLDTHDTQIVELQEKIKIAESVANKDKIDEVTKLISNLESLLKTRDQEVNSFEVKIGMTTQKILSRKEDLVKISNLGAELKQQEKHHSLCLKAQTAFSPTGVPAWIINTILDDLQFEANKILAEIRPEIELNFALVKTRNDGNQEDTLDINYRVNGVEHDYEMLSGGQKVIVALTFKMAMSHVIQHRIGVDIKLLNLDEVDSQFDDQALDAFIDIIKRWQSKLTIFVVTHNPYVKSKFQNAILVESDGVNGSCGKLIYN